MENFKMWLEELKKSAKVNDLKKIEKAETELKNFYEILLMQNEFLKEEIEDLKSRLEY